MTRTPIRRRVPRLTRNLPAGSESALSGGPSAALPSLRRLLHRAYVVLALGAVAIVGLVLAVPAVTALHIYANHDLTLIARAIGFTVEAAVVFEDTEAAQDALNSIVHDEDVFQATITTENGHVLARWSDQSQGWRAKLGAAASRLLNETRVSLPIRHDGASVGHIEVQGGGRTLARFLFYGILGILLCQAFVAAGAIYLSGRIVGRIIGPLHALAQVAAIAQRDRAFGQRVPASSIAELDVLGQSFNSLLTELDQWHSFMEHENQRLTHQASHDNLTGLANRAFFEGRLNRALVDARASDTGVAVMLIDCDKFKLVNDTHGHAAGDAVLVNIAARLQGEVRETDLVARLGGDEFAILLVPAPSLPKLHAIGDAIRLAMQMPVILRNGDPVTASLSIGFATSPRDGTTAPDLLQHADQAMYQAKGTATGPGQNGVTTR